MTENTEIRRDPAAVAKTMQGFAQRGMAIQAEFAQGLLQANRHWLAQARTEWTEALELYRKLASNETTAEKVDALQTWLKAATERGLDDASYAIEVARALGSIELSLFAPASAEMESPAPTIQNVPVKIAS